MTFFATKSRISTTRTRNVLPDNTPIDISTLPNYVISTGCWDILSTNVYKFYFGNSPNCGGSDGYKSCTAQLNFTPDFDIYLKSIDVEGNVEYHDAGFDRAYVLLNGQLVLSLGSVNADQGCLGMGPPAVYSPFAGPYRMAAGITHQITLIGDTVDANYHTNGYYILGLNISPFATG